MLLIWYFVDHSYIVVTYMWLILHIVVTCMWLIKLKQEHTAKEQRTVSMPAIVKSCLAVYRSRKCFVCRRLGMC